MGLLRKITYGEFSGFVQEKKVYITRVRQISYLLLGDLHKYMK